MCYTLYDIIIYEPILYYDVKEIFVYKTYGKRGKKLNKNSYLFRNIYIIIYQLFNIHITIRGNSINVFKCQHEFSDVVLMKQNYK